MLCSSPTLQQLVQYKKGGLCICRVRNYYIDQKYVVLVNLYMTYNHIFEFIRKKLITYHMKIR